MSLPLFSARSLVYLGWALVVIGLVCNEWVLKRLFSSDGVLEVDTRSAIWIFDLAVIVVGLITIKVARLFSDGTGKSTKFAQKYPALTASLVGVFAFLGTLGFVELIFWGLNNYRQLPEAVYEGGWRQREAEKTISYQTTPQTRGSAIEDQLLGFKSPANAHIRQVKKKGNDVIYDVIYTTDRYGRRITPVNSKTPRSRFALFLGCSITFGQGVNDAETLPFFFGEKTVDFTPYNYGVMGYGPQSMLTQLKYLDLRGQIKEQKGIGIYFFTEDHVSRAAGVMHIVNYYASRMPYYTIDADDKLDHKGDFTSGRPLIAFLYWLLGKSQIVRYWKIDFPSQLSDYHFKLTAKIMVAARDEFKRQFPESEFYVLFGPAYWNEKSYVHLLAPYLREAGVKYLDYSAPIWPLEDYVLVGDPHPSAKGHRLMAERLIKDLGIDPS